MGNSCLRTVVVAVMLPSITGSSTGCYSAIGDATASKSIERPTSVSSVPYGTALDVVPRPAEGPDTIVWQVQETPQCRATETGDTYAVGTRTLHQNMWPVIPGAIGLCGGGMAVFTGLLFSDGDTSTSSGRSQVEISDTLLPVGGVAMGVGAVALIVWALMPSERTSEVEEKGDPYLHWKAPPAACGKAEPFATATTVKVDFQQGASHQSIASWKFPTDDHGVFRSNTLLPTVKRIASYCGAGTLVVSDTSPREARVDSDSPDAFTPVVAHHGTPLEIPIAVVARPTLASMAIEDPAAATIARACCKENVRAVEDETCAAHCLYAAGLEKCQSGMRKCKSVASRGSKELKAAYLSQCDSLLNMCLVEHGSSSARLVTCTATCVEQKVEEVCK